MFDNLKKNIQDRKDIEKNLMIITNVRIKTIMLKRTSRFK